VQLNNTYNQPTGKVILVGAGPGDAELVTLKAIRHLQRADIVLTDRLVNPEIISEHAPQAIVIPVGKQCRKKKSTPQATINELLIHHAMAGRYVVRLKGGDVSVFSNIADELDTLITENIPYEIVPGVTAALGASASLGVPLTARGLSKGVRLLTYYNADAVEDKEWENLAQTNDTLVFYMSGETCFALAEKLVAHGKKTDTPVLLAEQATTPLEAVSLSTIGNCREEWQNRAFLSPALLIIGSVAALHHKYAWKDYLKEAGEYFPEVTKTAAKPKKSLQPVTVDIKR
jgi:uroporphyrin-III C-methyltransferase/precorrin-2 dehydrogenase/sirohydrochlorin ferrochelatase/uroporphyrin-III C-methyltransferase